MFPPLVIDIDLDLSAAAAANAHRQPAPPPQLPLLQLPGRHQDPFRPANTVTVVVDDSDEDESDDGSTSASQNAQAGPSCPLRRQWPARGDHPPANDVVSRSSRFSDAELELIFTDMAVLVRREFDCWVEACW